MEVVLMQELFVSSPVISFYETLLLLYFEKEKNIIIIIILYITMKNEPRRLPVKAASW